MDPVSQTATEISVIVCTRNRGQKLLPCLRSIEAAATQVPGLKVELIVVNNGSTDSTAELLANLSFNASVHFHPLFEPATGLSRARNLGLEHATGKTLVFTDDDCEMHPHYLIDLMRHAETDVTEVIRGGCVQLGSTDYQPVSYKDSPDRERFEKHMVPGGFLLGCNMTMQRSVAEKVGLFDIRFGAGAPFMAAEDTDFLLRALAKGIVIEYVPDMVVIHFHGRTSPKDVEAINHGYHIGNGALYMKHLRFAPWLVKHFLWALRGGIKELMGGPLYCPGINVSHWPVVRLNLIGAGKYLLMQAGSLLRLEFARSRPIRTKIAQDRTADTPAAIA